VISAPDSQAYAAYRAEVTGERMVPALRAGILVILGVTATFPVLDWIAFPEQFWKLSAVRLALALSFVGLWFSTPRAPERSMLALVFFEGLHLVAVIGIAGGVTSPYYPGIMLLFLGLPAVLPVTLRQTAWMLGPLLALFGALPVLGAGRVELRDYLMSMFFVGGSVAVSVISSWLLDNLRFQDHRRRAEITAARDELAKLDDVKTRFTANVHHELRTPLTLMLAPLEGIRSGDYGEVAPEMQRTLRTMHTNGKRLLKLINNLLDLAKLESQQFEIRRAPFEVVDLIESVVEGAVPMAERKGVELVVERDGEEPSIHADGEALEKVFVNLLGNALKFTDAGGSIAVGAAPAEDGGIEAWVRDTGVGLAPEQLERVFDRFAQVDASATRKHEGTGIGLSLSTELVELHGGRIWAESEGLGHGATMRFVLPAGESDVVPEEAAIVTAAAGDVALGAGRSIEAVEAELGLGSPGAEPDTRYVELDRSAERWEQRQGEVPAEPGAGADPDRRPILVVDDNADMRELIEFILGREFAVRTARNGREALDVLQGFEPDLVVSDIMMPEMSGTELCAAIKGDARLRDIPVMLVSSKAESEMKIEGLELGADDYVTKPFHPRELLARARSHAALRRARLELSQRNAELERALDELRQAEAQLVQSERLAAVGELAAGIAHEVNNPVNYALNAVRALGGAVAELRELAADVCELDFEDLAKLASEGTRLRERVEAAGADELGATVTELADIVSEGLERTQRLVGQLRDFAAPGGGEQHPIDLRDGVRATAQLMRHELEAAGLELELELPESLQLVQGDPGALNQVFLNLLKNAAEAKDGRGGSVAVAVREQGSEVSVEVRDDGPGIPDEVREHLFEPFFTTKAAGAGSGLGLSMCRRIADAHGGRIELESTLGQGSCFRLVLPALGEVAA
jgi:signal transduction histidine kinase